MRVAHEDSIPYSIARSPRSEVARLSMPHWVEFLERHTR